MIKNKSEISDIDKKLLNAEDKGDKPLSVTGLFSQFTEKSTEKFFS